jgi:nucleoside phosphorylase
MREQNLSSFSQVVILTALPVEYQAVRRHLEQIQEVEHPQGTLYERGTFAGQERSWQVAIAEIGMGGSGAAAETERAIHFFQAQIALFVGIAGGIKDVQRGDVVVARKVYNYEAGKVAKDFLPRPEVWSGNYALVQRARADARNKTWLERLPRPAPDPSPRVLLGALAAGEKVVASTKSSVYHLLQKNYSDALAVEMEGHGFLDAVQANHKVQGLVIRGISDLIDDKLAADTAGFQERASQHAAAFAFEVLSHLSFPEISEKAHPSEIMVRKQSLLQKQYEEKENIVMKKIEIFLAYAPKDENYVHALLGALDASLKSLKQKSQVSLWSEMDLLPGAAKKLEIQRHVQSAQVFLLLISADFFATDFYDNDLPDLMKRCSAGDVCVIPILMREAYWQEGSLGELQPLPDTGEFVNSSSNKDRALLNIARGVRRVIDELIGA